MYHAVKLQAALAKKHKDDLAEPASMTLQIIFGRGYYGIPSGPLMMASQHNRVRRRYLSWGFRTTIKWHAQA